MIVVANMGLGPGYAVSKHVKLVRLLGRGGMGSVWIADHLGLKTRVAVKFMSDMYSSDPAMLTRFQREATSAAQIGSPHIVNIHDHGTTADGEPYMVMELLDGEDLSARIKRVGPLPLDDVAKIVSQTCKALGKAHRLGIVHRDIKPNNIFLVDAEGDIFVKVLDFGVAKPGGGESSEVTSTGAVVGTVIYASPEQLVNARSVDFRADLWSLGVVAYRAMTGKLPFSDANGIGALALAQINEQFRPPSKLMSDIPPEVDEWCRRAFKHDPVARFESAREMADALYTALGRTSSPALTRTRPTKTKASPSPEPEAATVIERSSGSVSSTKDSAPSEATKNPISLGAASAMTYVGESTTNTSLPTRRRRRTFVIAAVIASLLGAGALTFVLLKRITKPHVEASTRPSATETNSATASPPTPPTTDIQVVPTSVPVELVPSSSAPSAAAPSAAASSAAASSAAASSAAAPSASAPDPKARTKQGGSSRNPLPEKDYGF